VSPRGLYRAPSLVPLSRDHHEALVQALWLRRAAGQADAALRFLEYHEAELEGHMADEEDVVLPVAEPFDPEGSARIREEHARIRELTSALGAATASGGEIHATMEALAGVLHDHVRYEERVFFMAVQAAVPPEALDAMGAALEAHRAARGVAAFCRVGPRTA
jgi:iron-sulfur cluster repair protein YtfE (RIC family)